MNGDAVFAELLKVETMLQDVRLNDDDRHLLQPAQRALRNIRRNLAQASQTFRDHKQLAEAASLLLH